MAEVTGLRNNALPYPVYGAPWAVVFPMFDADGDLVTGATTPDAERSLNGDTFADCTNESVEIATASGMYYLLLTAAEMTADVVTVMAKSATAGMKTTALVFYPRKLVSLRAGTSQAGAAGTITLDSGASAVDDYYNGCLIVGVLDSTTEARIITDYAGSTKVASVTPNWNVTPDSDDTFTIYLPEGRQVNQADPVAWNGTTVGTVHTAGYPVVTIKDGTGTGEIDTTSGGVLVAAIAANAITATAIASDAITDAKVASDVTIASVTGAVGSVTGAVGSVTGAVGSVASGGITAASFAADAITAAKLHADVTTELQSGLATAANLATVAGYLDTEVAAILAAVDTEVAAIVTATEAPAIRTALGLASANLDTQLDALPTANENADALLDRTAGIETNRTLRQGLRLMLSALVGKASGLAGTTATFRDTNDGVDRIVATVDDDGNRSAVTLDAS